MRLFPHLALFCLTPALAQESPTVPSKTTPPPAPAPLVFPDNGAPGPGPDGMVWIPGGTYTRGEDREVPNSRSQYPEEKPAHRVTIDGFWLDASEVTNAEFLKFVEATGYKTQAETGWSAEDFPAAPPDQLKGGALCFAAPAEAVELWRPGAEWQWWRFVQGANWRHPQGPESSIADKMDHPVVCVTHEDALAYCKWAGKRLPTEAEWERAARGGLDRSFYAWGDEPTIEGQWMANVFQGEFPNANRALDGFAGTSPAKVFPPNPYGLFDMAGNVWEHCADLYRPEYYQTFANQKDSVRNPTGPSEAISQPMAQGYLQTGSYEPDEKPFHKLSWLWVAKGGSHLCHTSYCLRYRPAARHFAESLSPTNHCGFRAAKSK